MMFPWPASELSDVLAACAYYLSTLPTPPEVLLGERYLAQEGAANRVLFVPGDGVEVGAGDGRQINTGSIYALAESCDAYVWGAENVDDFQRYAAAVALRRELLNALHRSAPGRIKIASVRRLVATNITTFGEEFVIRFSYTSEIKKTAIAAIPAPGAPTSPPDPQLIPPLPTGVGLTVTGA